MSDPRLLKIEDFDYPLPTGKIARFPLAERDRSKLLIYRRGQGISQDFFFNLPAYLPENSLLVLNNTRVVRARLLFQKPSGANIEIFCLDPVAPTTEIQTAFLQPSPVSWHCLIGNAKRWKKGTLELKDTATGNITLFAERKDHQTILFSWSPSGLPFSEIISSFGHVPIPPYLEREDAEIDNTRYQTIYARPEGSVAAPTAGLHFTEPVFAKLKDKNIDIEYLTLHVGAGTFRPVTADLLEGHVMHAEQVSIPAALVRKIRDKASNPLIAVGTTSVRSLESLYWLGVQVMDGRSLPLKFEISQWEAYQRSENALPTAGEALSSLLSAMENQNMTSLEGSTSMIIAPGYSYRLLDGMITNFHQPKSTLLLLISAFLGDNWREIYTYALEHDFRFLSYGDSCLFL